MGKNFHFQTPFHFLNFCNKYINLEEEDKKVLEYFVDKAIKGDMLCQAIINRFTAILKFEQNNTLDREKIILAQEYKKAIFNEMDKVRNAR